MEATQAWSYVRQATRRFFAAAVLGLFCPFLPAQETALAPPPLPPSTALWPVTFTEHPPEMDGRLNDACWAKAPAFTNFTQVLPVEGAPPSETTEVRLLFTRDYLYIGVRCYDSQPQSILAKQMQHDANLRSDDYFMVALDSFNRQREGCYFMVNPAGVRAEGLIENFSVANKSWDTLWHAHARVDEHGWTAELAIPFRSLGFDPQTNAWGCNFERVIRRKQEIVRWTALSPAKAMTTLADFGQIQGLEKLRQGKGLELRPFASGKFRDDRLNARQQWEFRPGLDVTYQITPMLKLQGTLNTDFAEAEVDERVVNLTRFPLFFPEKRDFFLQDASVWRFGGLTYSPLPFYSRRIGLAEDGMPVDLLGGARLTGRLNGTTLGLLNVQQEAYRDVPSKNLTVARLSQLVFEESNVGLLLTHGDPRQRGDNTVVGADFNYLNSRLPGNRQLLGHAFLLMSDSDAKGGRGLAWGFKLDFPNEPLEAEAIFRQVDARFDPALGFVSRRDIRQYILGSRYVWRLNTRALRSISLGVRPTWATDTSGRLIEEDYDLPYLMLTTPAGDTWYMEYSLNRDVVDAPFEMWPGVWIPADDYGWGGFRTFLRTSEARPLSWFFNYRHGDYYHGTRQDYLTELNWRPSSHWLWGLNYQLRRVRLPSGDFDARLAGLRLNLTFTPNLSWNNLVQYENQTRSAGWNSRLRWTFRPGCDAYLVFNQGMAVEEWRLSRQWSEISCKVVVTLRF
ncbi:MAG: carbohydrate binding family 9 domain-containing protein [Verrucomicrobiae bacterium]|nr:carbohydrate binding family 9 domain-containing protein [Verrucomicrobiae bacterium]